MDLSLERRGGGGIAEKSGVDGVGRVCGVKVLSGGDGVGSRCGGGDEVRGKRKRRGVKEVEDFVSFWVVGKKSRSGLVNGGSSLGRSDEELMGLGKRVGMRLDLDEKEMDLRRFQMMVEKFSGDFVNRAESSLMSLGGSSMELSHHFGRVIGRSDKDVDVSSSAPTVKKGADDSGLLRSHGSLLGLSQGYSGIGGLNGIPLHWDGGSGDSVRIPKKPRGYVGSKPHVSKKSGPSWPADQIAKLSSEFEESGASHLTAAQNSKIAREEELLAVKNRGRGESSSRKRKSNQANSTRNNLNSGTSSYTKKVESVADKAVRMSDYSEDDEENLEENAAIMLSSRFDPRCTGPSVKRKFSLFCSAKDMRCHVENTQVGVVPVPDSAGRVARQNEYKEKGSPKKRRHFYEVVYKEEYAHLFLNRRIKVFWPLDESWYDGVVNAYDDETKLHHVKYDDRDMEWIGLQNEQFKLLLFSHEFKDTKKSKEDFTNGRPKDTVKKDLSVAGHDTNNGFHTDSEPISSWLARSAYRPKSSSISKKQKRSNRPSVVPQLSNDVGNARENEDSDLVARNPSKTTLWSEELVPLDSCSFTSEDRIAGGRKDEKYVLEGTMSSKEDYPPVVYFRRRFRKNKEGSFGVSVNNNVHICPPRCVASVAGSFQTYSDCMDSEKLLSINRDGMLTLHTDLIHFKEFKYQLSLGLRPVLERTFDADIFRLFRLSLLPRYRTIVITWPKVRFEVLFVDNSVGLRFFLYEGCLEQAVYLIFLILTLFRERNEPGTYVDLEMPTTSIRFMLSVAANLRKQHVFEFYSFSKLTYSNWFYLDSMFEHHCLFTKQLPLPECTFDNIKSFEGGSKHTWEPLYQVAGNRSVVPIDLSRSCDRNGRQSPRNVEYGTLLPFSLSFSAAPTFFVSLHLKLLVQSIVSCISPRVDDPDCHFLECFDNDAPPVTSEKPLEASLGEGVCSEQQFGTDCMTLSMDASSINSSQHLSIRNSVVADTCTSRDSGSTVTDVISQSQKCEHNNIKLGTLVTFQPPITQDSASPGMSGANDDSIFNGISVEIPVLGLLENSIDEQSPSLPRASDVPWDMTDGIICSPNPSGLRSLCPLNRTSSINSPLEDTSSVWLDSKTNGIRSGFGNGPRKPRTQVKYALTVNGSECSSKSQSCNQNGRPYRRIRGASVKKTSDTSVGSQRNLELLACDANVLITLGDKGWRECGAQVVLELANYNEWKLNVKFSGVTKYSHKVQNDFQPGSTNRYTHAMMWKGQDWSLEFPERIQWMLFKEMHRECYNRNIRAASVKYIPIPGVRLINDFENKSVESQFTRNSNYFRQIETDVDMAMNPLKTFYDMDSDDEQWILAYAQSFQTQENMYEVITDELFEKTMDVFEKSSYIHRRDRFTDDEIEKLMAGVAPFEVTKAIYQHWQKKRQENGMALIRQLQPPLWERYQQQVNEWDKTVRKANTILACGDQAKAPPKPAMFAFCLKPRGLEPKKGPNNKGSSKKGLQRKSLRKFSVSSMRKKANFTDHDGVHAFGNQLNSFTCGDEKASYPGNSLEHLDTSPLLHSSTMSREDPGFFSLNNGASEWNDHPKQQKKLKKIKTFLPTSKLSMAPSRSIGKRNDVQCWIMGSPERPSEKHQQSDVSTRLGMEQLGDQYLDDLRFREALSSARKAQRVARVKKYLARKMFLRSDIATHMAVSALMIADSVKASYECSNGGVMQNKDNMSG